MLSEALVEGAQLPLPSREVGRRISVWSGESPRLAASGAP